MNEQLAFAKALALEAGQLTLHAFGQGVTATWKDDNTPLTTTDTAINEMVIKRVMTTFPTHGVLGEEASYEENRDKLWVVDPIDGTQPFSVGAPLSAFSIAYVVNNEPRVGVIYDPYQDRLFTAIKGRGAWLNGVPINMIHEEELHYIALASRPAEGLKTNGQLIDSLDEMGIKWFNFRCFVYGSMLVSTGAISATIMGRPKPWDIAASKLIVEESGGKVTDLYGNSAAYNQVQNGFLLSNGVVHDQILNLLKR